MRGHAESCRTDIQSVRHLRGYHLVGDRLWSAGLRTDGEGIVRPRTRRACGPGGPTRRGAASMPRSAERTVLTHLLTTDLD